MAISIYGSGAQAISTPGDSWNLQEVTGPGAFTALIDVQHHNGLEVRAQWISDDGAEPTASWGQTITADNTTPDGPITILTPPVPIATTGRLHLDYYSGTPGSPAEIPWVVYKL